MAGDRVRPRAVADALGAGPAPDFGPSPYGPGGTPYGPGGGTSYLPPTAPVPAPGPKRPYAPYGGPPAGRARRRGTGVAFGVAGVALVGVLVAVLIDQHGGSGGGGGSSGSGGKSPSTSAPADTLPDAWLGTWYGEGPGSALEGSDGIEVTLALTGGKRGSTVGRQVSNVRVAGTTADAGCTEDLQLSEMQGDTMAFVAVTSTPTDTSLHLQCTKGRHYVLSMSDATHLRLDAGSQALGSPTALEKKSG
ncbi:hypothetical protein [Actinacidiphila bryophytorum]|uniref:Uncharacterized protein n=1 Tax=Actinacidiphila bryophytorum TaxID=1436133 RepID=A0A9W4H741_9ACTN|nr:hypothetical protein [Actinacidiphila bryophytorum]MBM9439578.1 hypothetical protein [Actinacidiphila bryophytorum]MBN6544949.1 hypothetical protein [Actinacidiphila bryophytorum]CAG7655458.1 hypothetical protein SBRY_70135 [Actinacidiphila bryophytorum]